MSLSLTAVRRAIGLDLPPERPYACPGCESRFELQHHVCPVCGGYSMERAVCS
jgi:rRNA maturation endonuclease Nob1